MKKQNEETKKIENVSTTKKIDLNSILSIGNSNLINKVRGGATLYNVSLFEGLNDKEKKHLRIKLRRKLDSFINSAFEFVATKTPSIVIFADSHIEPV